MKNVIHFALDISESVQYIRHSHLVSFKTAITDNDLFVIFESVAYLFLKQFPTERFLMLPSFIYQESKRLTMCRLATTEQHYAVIDAMFNYAHQQMTKDLCAMQICEPNNFNYRLDKIEADTFAIFYYLPPY